MRPPARPRAVVEQQREEALRAELERAKPRRRRSEPPGRPAQPAPDRGAAGHPARHGDVTGRPAHPAAPRTTTSRVATAPAGHRQDPSAGQVVSPLAARAAERDRARRRVTRRKAMTVSAVVAAVAAVAWVVMYSPWLSLDPAQVEVSGTGTVVDPARVQELVEARAGTPLAVLDVGGMTAELLDVPGVREAEISRVWPDGLTVALVSREPVAAAPDAAGGYTLLDMDGVRVGHAEDTRGLAVMTVPVGDGQDGGANARIITAVLTVLAGLPAELRAEVAEVSASSPDTVAMVLHDGARVEWGSAQDVALKVEVLAVLRGTESTRGAAVFDVSAPAHPITRSS